MALLVLDKFKPKDETLLPYIIDEKYIDWGDKNPYLNTSSKLKIYSDDGDSNSDFDNESDIITIGGVYELYQDDDYIATLDLSNLDLSNLNIPIVDNLTSTDTDKALSANQGKVLKDLVTNNALVTSKALNYINSSSKLKVYTDNGDSDSEFNNEVDEIVGNKEYVLKQGDDVIATINISTTDVNINYGTFRTDTTPMVDGAAKVSDVQQIIDDNEEIISAALNDFNIRINDSDLYISSAEDTWTTSAVGSIPEGKTKADFAGKTVSEMIDMILYPNFWS